MRRHSDGLIYRGVRRGEAAAAGDRGGRRNADDASGAGHAAGGGGCRPCRARHQSLSLLLLLLSCPLGLACGWPGESPPAKA